MYREDSFVRVLRQTGGAEKLKTALPVFYFQRWNVSRSLSAPACRDTSHVPVGRGSGRCGHPWPYSGRSCASCARSIAHIPVRHIRTSLVHNRMCAERLFSPQEPTAHALARVQRCPEFNKTEGNSFSHARKACGRVQRVVPACRYPATHRYSAHRLPCLRPWRRAAAARAENAPGCNRGTNRGDRRRYR